MRWRCLALACDHRLPLSPAVPYPIRTDKTRTPVVLAYARRWPISEGPKQWTQHRVSVQQGSARELSFGLKFIYSTSTKQVRRKSAESNTDRHHHHHCDCDPNPTCPLAMAAAVRRSPYKDFLQPALQRRFATATLVVLATAYFEALLLARWSSCASLSLGFEVSSTY